MLYDLQVLPGLKFRWPKLNLLFAEENLLFYWGLNHGGLIIIHIVISGELTGSGSQSVTWLECFNIITQHKYLWHQVWVEGKQGEHQNNLSQKNSGFSKCRLSTYVLSFFQNSSLILSFLGPLFKTNWFNSLQLKIPWEHFRTFP